MTGDARGEAAAYLVPRPRDYRRGVFKFTSTPYGAKPRRVDLIRTIRYGAKATSMPSFRWLAPADVEAVVDYVILLSFRGEIEYRLALALQDYEEDEPLAMADAVAVWHSVDRTWEEAARQVVVPQSPRPPYDEASIALGRQLYPTYECAKCHGPGGRGQTEWLSPRFIARQQSVPPEQRVQINYDIWG